MEAVLYFPGCGGALFYDRIGLSTVMLLLKAGYAVAVPPSHLCCGYPLLAAGMETEYEDNKARDRQYLASMLRSLVQKGFACRRIVTSCPTCLDSLERFGLSEEFPDLEIIDAVQLALPRLEECVPVDERRTLPAGTSLLYHGSCHCPWAGVHRVKGHQMLMKAVNAFSGAELVLSPGCCGESGMGASYKSMLCKVYPVKEEEM